jgi:gephyrin
MKEMGVEVVDLGIASDTRESLESKIREGLEKADVLLTSGGVSMGELDLIQPILQESLKGKIHFGRVLMKPGKPLTFATVEYNGKTKLVFGLPGNPVSSVVTFYLAAVPCIRKLSGFANPQLPMINVKINKALKLDPERPEYHRANLSWDNEANMFVATSTGSFCNLMLRFGVKCLCVMLLFVQVLNQVADCCRFALRMLYCCCLSDPGFWKPDLLFPRI